MRASRRDDRIPIVVDQTARWVSKRSHFLAETLRSSPECVCVCMHQWVGRWVRVFVTHACVPEFFFRQLASFPAGHSDDPISSSNRPSDARTSAMMTSAGIRGLS